MTAVAQLSFQFNKRWTHRAQRWVAPGRLFQPRDFAVDVPDTETVAKRWIVEHHYSGSFPAARLTVALYGRRAQLVGCAVFSVPMNANVVTSYTGAADWRAGVELGRFVCSPDVAYNGETWFLARAFAALREAKPEVEYVISYADPVARLNLTGELVKPEHWGTIYQASNALYCGRSSPRRLLYAPDGSVISERALSKLRLEERGWPHCYRRLIAAGAPERQRGELLAEWVRRVTTRPGWERRRHDGNLTYVFGLTKPARDSLREIHGAGLPYPKRAA